MKWNDERGYLTFQSSLNNVKTSLGVSAIDLVERCELSPYYTYILQYLGNRLLLLGDVDMKTKIQEIFDIFSMGTDKIISGATLDLAWELGIDTTDIYLEGQEIPYNQEYLVFCWANALTSLCTRLKLMYSHLLYQSTDQECYCCNGCSVGETTADHESWTSGVYPEDEKYPSYSTAGTNTAWRTGAENIECTKCYRS